MNRGVTSSQGDVKGNEVDDEVTMVLDDTAVGVFSVKEIMTVYTVRDRKQHLFLAPLFSPLSFTLHLPFFLLSTPFSSKEKGCYCNAVHLISRAKLIVVCSRGVPLVQLV